MNEDDIEQVVGVSEEYIERSAREFESGCWPGHLGKPRPGRPRLYDEEMVTVSFRLPRPAIEALQAKAERVGVTKSELFRRAIENELACDGVVQAAGN